MFIICLRIFRSYHARSWNWNDSFRIYDIKWRRVLTNRTLNTFIKYGIVGASGTLISMTVLYIFTDIFSIYYLLSGVAAIELSLLNNFFWNDRWTFLHNDHADSFKSRLVNYHIISLSGAVLNIMLLYVLTSILGFYYLLSNIMAICCVFIINYLINTRITWKEKN